MAIAFDAASADFSGSVTSKTVAHTVTGSDRLLLVCVLSTGSQTITGVTYNGTSMTQIGSNEVFDSPSSYYHSAWYLIAPDTGTNNIVASASGSCNIFVAGASYTGVKQTGFPDNNVHFEEYTPDGGTTGTITPNTDGCWVACLCNGSSPIEFDTQTGRAADSGVEYSIIGDTNGAIDPAASTSFDIGKIAVGNANYNGTLVSFEPASAPATGHTQTVVIP